MRVTQRPLFYWILHRHRGLQLVLLLVILASLFFRVFPLEMQKRIVNEAIHLRDQELLLLYCGLYIGAVILAGISKYCINVLQTVIGQKILVEMRTELYHHILQLPLQFYRQMQPGTVISALTAELNAIGFFLGGALAIPVTSLLTFLAFLLYMFSLSPLLAVLTVAIYPFEFALIPYLQKKYNRINKERIRTTRAMANVVNEAISGIHEIHSNASFELEEKRLTGFIQTLYRQLRRLFIVKYGIKFSNNLFQSFGPFILFLVGGYLAINGHFSLGALVAFLSAYEKVYDPWKEMLEYYQSYQDARVRYRQVVRIFDQEPPHPLLPEGHEVPRFKGEIELRNGSFTVEGGIRLLDRINMHIRPGELVALVGFSGSGKSTLALCMAQLYDLSSGSLLIDGHDISRLSKKEVSAAVTMIAQHPFIFTGTIRENLLYSVQALHQEGLADMVSRERMLEAVYDVCLDDDVIRFGFQSVLSREQLEPFREKLLHMRKVITTELHDTFSEVVEFYDVNNFLYYSSIRDNIVFGECSLGLFDVEKLPYHREFMGLLSDARLDRPLLMLGLAIAERTVELLGDFADDEFFFRYTPMTREELPLYSMLVRELNGELPDREADRYLLYVLVFRYIPGRHKVVGMPTGLEERMVGLRHRFLREVARVDMQYCISRGKGKHCVSCKEPEEEARFSPFCPGQYLYSRSLLDNILFGVIKSEEKMSEKLLNLTYSAFAREDLLDEVLDIGLDFHVGSKGDRLSGGQRQKVAIARALLKETPILIMDEATASLDNISQARIQQLLEEKFRGHRTMVSVIHRLDLAPGYDRIMVLQNGSLVEQGTYDELMAKRGAFYELIQGYQSA
ncbi:MAG TPA: ABC transporter ATP-binding protein [Desulfobulbus sp.]|nr:ABC transporter ATP-binding protein [Desulfobulbus sp.]